MAHTQKVKVKDIKKGDSFMLYGAIVTAVNDAEEMVKAKGFYVVERIVDNQYLSTNTIYCDLLSDKFFKRGGELTVDKLINHPNTKQ